MRKRPDAPTILSIAALALASIAVIRPNLGPAEAAAAQDQSDRRVQGAKAPPPFNPSAQRAAIVKQLELLNKKVDALNKKLDSGLTVKVSEMPQIVLPSGDGDK